MRYVSYTGTNYHVSAYPVSCICIPIYIYKYIYIYMYPVYVFCVLHDLKLYHPRFQGFLHYCTATSVRFRSSYGHTYERGIQPAGRTA